jgi:hypothetical protein
MEILSTPKFQLCASNNLLEHLAAIISPWVDTLAIPLKPNNCSISMTDSATAKGWLKSSNFSKLGETPGQESAKIKVARMCTSLFLKMGIKTYSQLFKGKGNRVADAPSCDDDRTNNELTLIMKSVFPSQVPSHFKVLQLPKEITSFLTALLCRLLVKEKLREEHM